MMQFDNAINRYKEMILDELHQADIYAWIAGGSLRDYFTGQPITTDHDIFFQDEESFLKALNHMISKGGKVVWTSDNGTKVKYGKRKFDLVKKYFLGPRQTIDQFDFTVSMLAVDSEKVYHGETTFIDLAKRQLVINQLPFPRSTMSRVLRYYTKGYRMCNGELRKVIEQIEEIAILNESRESSGQDPEDEKPPSGDSDSSFFSGID